MNRARRQFSVKRLPDGRALINLGSSAHTAPGWNNVDCSWIVRIGRHRRLCQLLHRAGLVSDARLARIQRLDPDTVVWDLSKGIPYADETFDVVYHSHLLEHLEREAAPRFLQECKRVLKPDGILRVVVPDLEQLAQAYLKALALPSGPKMLEEHSFATEELFDQMVRRRPKVRDEQRWFNRLIEAILVGDNQRNGTMHRWMYDRVSLQHLLESAGLVCVQQMTHSQSQIEGWNDFYLDIDADGVPCRHNTPRSLYLEARRPMPSSHILSTGGLIERGLRRAS